MKRFLLVLVILVLAAGGLVAQTLEEFETSFQDFADGVANSLPITASVGLNWSPAYIGQFPHFGVGVSLGGMFLPYDSAKPVVDALGLDAQVPEALKTYGLPFPSIAAGARLGGIGFPFDVGFKFGVIPEQAKHMFSEDVTADYLLVGGDVRVPLIKGRGIVPTLSVGGGYTFLRGTLGITDVVSGEVVDIHDAMVAAGAGGTTTDVLQFTDPDLNFSWDSHVFEGKLQASWDLGVLTPHVGLGGAYGVSNAGGGLFSEVVYLKDGTPTSLSEVETALEGSGYPIPTVDGLEVMSTANGYSFWVYGGTAVNIFIVRIDLSAMYNLVNKDYGASVNVRVQL